MSRGGKLTLDLPKIEKLPTGRHEGSAGSTMVIPEAVIPEKEWRNRQRANVLAGLRQAGLPGLWQKRRGRTSRHQSSTLASRLKALGINKRDYLE